jgi:hypothetical protein
VSLPVHQLEARVRDAVCDESAEARRQDGVELAREDQGRRDDLREAVRRVVPEADVDLRLEGLDRLLMGPGQRLSTIPSTEPSAWARGV